MKHKLAFLVYLPMVVFVSSLSSIILLAPITLLLLLGLLLKGKRSWLRIKAIILASLFSLMLTLPYSLWSGFLEHSLLIFLRVLSLYLLTTLLLSIVNLYVVFGFSKSLSALLVLGAGFSLTYRRVLEEFLHALKSRNPNRLEGRAFLGFLQRLMEYFFERSIRDAQEVSMAMKSRGFDLD